MSSLIKWVTFVNLYGSTLFTYGDIPNKTSSTLLSLIHQNSVNSTHVIKSIYFGQDGIISFQTIFDAKKEDVFIYSIIMCTSVQSDELNRSIFKIIREMTNFRCGQIEERTVHEDKESLKRRLLFLNHTLEEMNSLTMEIWIPYPRFQHFYQTKKLPNLFTDHFGEMPVGLYHNGNFWMGNDDWIGLGAPDLKLIQLFINTNPMETCRDIPIYVKDGKRSCRLLTIKVNESVDVYLLAAAKPSVNQVVDFMRSNESTIKEWISKEPIGITDENIVEFLYINHESSFYVHEKKEDVLMGIYPILRKFQCDAFSMKHKQYIVQFLRQKKREIFCVSKKPFRMKDLFN